MNTILNIIIAAAILGLLGLIFGLLLGVAAKIFAVNQDERIPMICDVLPGANCGGCGYPGCSNYADAIVKNEEETNKCPVGGDAVAIKVAEIMGKESKITVKNMAVVLCVGTKSCVTTKYIYDGPDDCIAASKINGGPKSCPNGCLGLGTCVKKCLFGAISIKDGVAIVDSNKCTACGACAASCPRGVISFVPVKSNLVFVKCSSNDPGAVTRKYCTVGCIGCKICVKTCKNDAIHVNGNYAAIDYEKCIHCGECVEKCPKGVIFQQN